MQRRHVIPTTLALVIAASLGSPRLLAATPINQTRALGAHGKIQIDNVKGRIEVHAWDRNEVRITGSLGDGVEKLVVDGDNGHLLVRAQYPRQIGAWRGDRTGPSTLQLQVPLHAALDIQSVSADIDVQGVASDDLGIDSVSGKVVVTAAPARADIHSVSGDLRITINSPNVKIGTVSGDVALGGRLDGEVYGETVSGKLVIDSIERLRRLTANTVSGAVVVHTALADGGAIRAETVSGDVRLALPAALSARMHAETFSGSLRAPGATIRKEDFGPGSSLDQSYGSGSGDIRIDTFSGDVALDWN